MTGFYFSSLIHSMCLGLCLTLLFTRWKYFTHPQIWRFVALALLIISRMLTGFYAAITGNFEFVWVNYLVLGIGVVVFGILIWSTITMQDEQRGVAPRRA